MSDGRAGLWPSPARPSTRLREPRANISERGNMTKPAPKSERDKAERLAAALRENLKRRKAQSRETQNQDANQPAKE